MIWLKNETIITHFKSISFFSFFNLSGIICICNCIGCGMVSVLTSSVVNRGFEHRMGQTKDYKIGICCFSTKHAALRLVGSESG